MKEMFTIVKCLIQIMQFGICSIFFKFKIQIGKWEWFEYEIFKIDKRTNFTFFQLALFSFSSNLCVIFNISFFPVKECLLNWSSVSMKTLAIIYCLLIDALKPRLTLMLALIRSAWKMINIKYIVTTITTIYTKQRRDEKNFHIRQSQFRINSPKIYNQLTDLRNECSTLTFWFDRRLFFFILLSSVICIGIFHVFMCIALYARKVSNLVKRKKFKQQINQRVCVLPRYYVHVVCLHMMIIRKKEKKNV